MHANVNNWERVASIAAGAALVALAVKSPRFRRPAGLTGAGLMARGATGLCPVNAALGRGVNHDTKVALAGSRGIRIEGGIVIGRPAEDVFDFWRDLSNLPQFMSHLERIDVLNGRRSHWVVSGPAGVTIEWDADIINERRPDLIAWQSGPTADVASAGSVQFRPLAPDLTDVTVLMQYDPPVGKIGAAVAALAGHSPSSMLRDDLRRLKSLLEST